MVVDPYIKKSGGKLHRQFRPLGNIPACRSVEFMWIMNKKLPNGAKGQVTSRRGDYQHHGLDTALQQPERAARCNVRVSNSRETFENLFFGRNGCAKPIKPGVNSNVDGCKFILSNHHQATFIVNYK